MFQLQLHRTNKRFIQLLFCFLIIHSFCLTNADAQTVPSLFVVVDFMKVEPENLNNYLAVEQDLWKPLHQERINRGIIVGWYLYAVEFSGTGDEYNYVVVSLYDSAEHLENPWDPEIPAKVHSKISIQEIMQRTHRSRKNIKSELFSSIATAPKIPMEKPAAYTQVSYMEVLPGKQSEYEKLESEIWLPIHNESIQSGFTTGWGLWKSLFPRGAGQEYQYLTLNTFSKFSTIFGLDYSIPFKNIHPSKDFGNVSMQTQESRVIVRSELWDLIDYAIR